jgi:hypothetical protein
VKQEEVSKMKWNPSEMHWMHRMHLPHGHAIHLHPVHWLGQHPLVIATIIATLLALAIIGLASLVDTGIRPDTLNRIDYPIIYPYSGAY